MKKIIAHCTACYEPLIIISALIIAMIGQNQLNLFFYWISFSLLLAVALWRLRKPTLYFPIIKDKAFLAYAIFIMWGVCSYLYWSVVKLHSITTIFTFLIGLLSYFIAYTDNSKTSKNVQKLLLALGLGLVTYTYYQSFVLEMRRPIGLLLNPNTHAALLVMILLPWALRYALNPKATNVQLGLICSISLLFSFALGLIQSRGALLILATGLFFLIIIINRYKLSYKQTIFLSLSIILGYMLSDFFIKELLFQRLFKVFEIQSYTATDAGRHLVWLPAWQMYLARPIFGWGLGAFALLFAQYKAPLTQEPGYFTHNDYLQFLVELGPVGLLLFLVFVFYTARKLYYLLQKQEATLSTNKIEAFILLTPCIGLLVHTFFTFHLYQLSMQIIFGYYLGQAAKCVQIEQTNLDTNYAEQADKKFLWFYSITCLISIALISMVGYTAYHITKAEKSRYNQLDHYKKASLFFPSFDKYYAIKAYTLKMQLQSIAADETTLQQRKRIANSALKAVNSAIKKNPLLKWNYITKAEILSSTPRSYLLASEQYAKALKIDPYLMELRYNYALFLDQNGQHKQAMELLWDGWGLAYRSPYKTALDYLLVQLQMNNKYGSHEDSIIIDRQGFRIQQLMKHKEGGRYTFYK